MSRVQLINTNETTEDRKAILNQIHGAFGAVPNMFRAVANSPAALKSMWGSFGALGSGILGAKLGEKIAVAIANRNRCEYCLAAHTVLGQNAGVSAPEMAAAQAGQSDDAQTAAALRFALKLVANRAQITDTDVIELRAVGFNDEQIVEIMAHVALNIFTNYVNLAFNVPIDFPKINLLAAD
ncbi:putative peroxidase-related enzyme [Candidatus Nitrotoga sp. HW29]|uniref:carboxymuconolactone decarboxylase family protein n=1 Tax=Candidatus Nitrotoga sp. HW29 TaxID=2886963 RepID=UPI001EF27C85|nr:peroxidase-related enzyme [Candidatus Nitrotoga sp. HW29]CAH1904960.1 putative peroxidase-related enzyme [Candidatus Nitrotoga sp. HW29]